MHRRKDGGGFRRRRPTNGLRAQVFGTVTVACCVVLLPVSSVAE